MKTSQLSSEPSDMQTSESSRKELLSPEQVANILGLAEKTLRNWRCTNRYHLPFMKVGTIVRYRAKDVDAFIEAHMMRQAYTQDDVIDVDPY